MSKRDEWLRELGPESFNRQPNLKKLKLMPTWDPNDVLGPPNKLGKNSLKEIKKQAHKRMAFHLECDRVKRAYLIQQWWEFLGVKNSDDALWELGVRMGLPAFQMPDKPPRPTNSGVMGRKSLDRDLRLALKIKELRESDPQKYPNDESAIRKIRPALKHDWGKIKSLKNRIGEIRTAYRTMGSRLFTQK